MKNFVMVILLLLSFVFKSQTTYTSDCIAHDTVDRFYIKDAQKLNMRHIFRANLTYKDSGTLSKTITNEYLSALTAIYNATAMPARDSVIDVFNIHCYNPGLNTLLIEADSGLQWVKNFKNNVFPTGQVSFDSIMNKYYLHKTNYMAAFSNTAIMVMHSDSSFNAPALGTFLINHVPGIFLWDLDVFIGEGNDIEDTVNSNFHWFRFTLGWSDCENGCIFHKYWEFRVHNDCTVEYGGTYGDPVYVGIKENEISFDEIKGYPNPTADKLNIEDLPYNSKLTLYNVLGVQIYSNNAPDKNTAIDLSSYAAGLYYLKIKKDQGQKVIKIVKE